MLLTTFLHTRVEIETSGFICGCLYIVIYVYICWTKKMFTSHKQGNGWSLILITLWKLKKTNYRKKLEGKFFHLVCQVFYEKVLKQTTYIPTDQCVGAIIP